MEKNYNISGRLGMCMTCMPSVSVMRSQPAAPALLYDLSIRTSELAVDEDGIESDGVSFKTDSTCWSALGSTRVAP